MDAFLVPGAVFFDTDLPCRANGLSVCLSAVLYFLPGFADPGPVLRAGFLFSISVNYQGAKVRLFGDNPF